MFKVRNLILCATAATTVALCGGCKTAAPKPSGFLSDYSRMQKADGSTWRYSDNSRLASCKKFVVSPAKVMVKEYWGTAFSADQREKIAATFRQKVVNALSGHYQVVSSPGPNTAEIRVAITQAYRVGNALALGVEAEIMDSESHQQLAALRGVRIGPPEVGFRMGYDNPGDPGNFIPAWWNWPSAVELMDRWSEQVRKMIEDAQQR
ncbi:MAG: DUF3313 family protein [Verrucomicrobiota bacterium]|nr:DUF3313 family protein [Verrucomicrobiota bacterium]